MITMNFDAKAKQLEEPKHLNTHCHVPMLAPGTVGQRVYYIGHINNTISSAS